MVEDVQPQPVPGDSAGGDGAVSRLIIAIDGPSGSGKSSTSRGVATGLRLRYLDTGAMYRAVAIAHRDAGLRPDQADETAALVRRLSLEISTDPGEFWIRMGGRDLTQEIRRPEVSQMVSTVATMLPLRVVLQDVQRRIIHEPGCGIVAEGRDITTVVAPDADLRILLKADPAERMRRRELELHGGVTQDQLRDQVLRRDRDDATVSSFAQAADGVYTLDSTFLTLDEVIDRICTMARQLGR